MDGGLVTVVFVDVERSTELLTRLGDEAGTATVGEVLATVRERIEPYGGRLVKSLGDGLMILFPGPRQAVSFAVAVQTALAGRRPSLRIGVNTGEVLGRSDDPVGEAVNAAARVADRAAGGEVLVSDVVRQLVGSMPGIRFSDRGRVRLKGFPDPWHLHAVAGGHDRAQAKPTFGRAAEIAELDWLLAGLGEGSGRALAIEGEAGIGKSHLVDVLAGRAETMGALVLAGGADEMEQERPGRILGAFGDRLEVSLGALLGSVDRRDGSRGFAVVEAVVDAVEKAAAGRPVVLVAEDLHWGDELSLRGIGALVRRLEPLPVALAVTLRPTPRPPLLDRVLSMIAAANGRHLRVAALDEVAVGSLVASVTGAAPGPTLSGRLGGAAGNPLFVIEMLRALDHDGALRIDAGVVDSDERALPADFRDAVVRRVSSMAPSTVEVLRLASLLGSEFPLRDVATVAGQSVVSVAAKLHEAVDAGILAGEGEALSFRHDLIREAIYSEVPPAIRRDLHAAAGVALADAGAPAMQIARQLALGARPGDIAAVEWLERAAHEALVLDPGAGVELLEQALALAPAEWHGRPRLETSLLEPLAWSGRIEQAQSLAQDLLRRPSGPGAEFAARRGLATVLASSGDLAAAVVACEDAASVPGAPVGEARVLRCASAGMALLTGRPAAEVRASAEAALDDAAATQDAALGCWAHHSLCLAAFAEGRFEDALHHADRSREILDRGSIPALGFLIPHLWVGSAHAALDQFDACFTAFDAGRARAERRGETTSLVLAHGGMATGRFVAGRWDEAVSEIEAGLTLAEETGAQAMTVLWHAVAARIRLGQGDLDAAAEHVDAADELLAAGRHLFGVDLLLWARAGLLEARADPAAALDVLVALWDQTAPLTFLLQYRNYAPDLVRLAMGQGDVDRAEDVAVQLEVAAERSSSRSATAVALRARGVLEHDAQLLVAAVDGYRRTPRRLELAGTCEDAAIELHAQRGGDEALELLEEAVGIYSDAGAERDVARVDDLLHRWGCRRRRPRPTRPTHGWAALSNKEREVVDLVVQGLSNVEIGEALFISRRTVETHVSHVFRKVGVTNRAQLAAAATRERSGRGGGTV